MQRVIILQPGEQVVIRCGEADDNNGNLSSSNESENELGPMYNINELGRLRGGKKTRKNRKAQEAPTRKAQEGGKKKRGPNGYMKFAAEMRPQILKENPDMRSNVVAVARKIGEAWRKLPEAERKKY